MARDDSLNLARVVEQQKNPWHNSQFEVKNVCNVGMSQQAVVNVDKRIGERVACYSRGYIVGFSN